MGAQTLALNNRHTGCSDAENFQINIITMIENAQRILKLFVFVFMRIFAVMWTGMVVDKIDKFYLFVSVFTLDFHIPLTTNFLGNPDTFVNHEDCD